MSGSAFTRPVQGADPAWQDQYQFAAAANGDTSWQRLWALTGVTDADSPVVTIQNHGAGGHLNVPSELQVASDGTGTVIRTVAVTAGATDGTTLGVTGTIIGDSTIQGTRLISTVLTASALSPLVVTSRVMVANLNAQYVGGVDLTGLGTLFVDAAGDTMTGLLTMEPSIASELAIKLKGSSTSGGFYLGATNAAAPHLTIHDTDGTLIATFQDSAFPNYGLTLENGIHVKGPGDFDGDMALGNAVGDAIDVRGTANFEQTPVFSANIDVQGGTAGQIRAGAVIVDAAALSGTEKLRVNGDSLLGGAVSVSGILSFASGGSVRYTAGSGLVLEAATGSLRDFLLGNPGLGTAIAEVLTGTTSMRLYNAPQMSPDVATSAAGALVLAFGSAGLGLYVSSGAPTVTAPVGSICTSTGGSGVANRLYVSKGAGNWASVSTTS